jgi:hypothetical protein
MPGLVDIHVGTISVTLEGCVKGVRKAFRNKKLYRGWSIGYPYYTAVSSSILQSFTSVILYAYYSRTYRVPVRMNNPTM